MGRQVRILEAKYAFKLAQELLDNDFILNLSSEDREIYKSLIHKIAAYVDGNTEVIHSAVREYFLVQHCKAGLDVRDISFSPKKSGLQEGFICDVEDGDQTTRYFIKTHQHGPTEDDPKRSMAPDAKELFIYKLLERTSRPALQC